MKLVSIVSFLLSMTFSFSSFAIRHVGNGGSGVICRNSSGEIVSAELLDLFEARAVYNLQLVAAQADYESQIAWLIGKSQYNFSLDRAKVKREFEDKALFVGKDLQLSQIPDSFEPVVPKNCQVEQVANYHQSGKIIISKEIWDAFSPLNKAALVAHEIVYKEARDRGRIESSYYVRRFIGFLFSTEKLEPYKVPDWYDVTYYCTNSDNLGRYSVVHELYLVSHRCGGANQYCDAKVVFRVLGGQVVYDQTELDKYAATMMLQLLEAKGNVTQNAARAKVHSKIFDGNDVIFSVSEGTSNRILSLMLYTQGEKELVPLKCVPH